MRVDLTTKSFTWQIVQPHSTLPQSVSQSIQFRSFLLMQSLSISSDPNGFNDSNPQKRGLVCVSPPKCWFYEPFSGSHLCWKLINLTRQEWPSSEQRAPAIILSSVWHFLQRLLFLVGWSSAVAEWLSVWQRTLHVHSHLCFFVSSQTLQ